MRFEVAKRHFTKGNVFFNNMQYLAAVEHFRKAVESYPDYYTAREYLARSYKLAGLADAALKEWENLYQINRENVAVLGKIDSLRYLSTKVSDSLPIDSLVFDQAYRSYKFKNYGFRHPLDIALDNEKNLYVTSFSSGKLVKIDLNGKGADVSRADMNAKYYGVEFSADRIIATDFQNDRFHLFNRRGDVVKTVGSTGSGEGQFHGPEGVCADQSGNIYVVDSANHRVQKFNPAGDYLLQFGKQGEYEGELNRPTDVVFLKGALYVTDTGNRRLACFDDSGNFIKNIEIDSLVKPRGISRRDDVLLVSDEKKGLLFFNTATGEKQWFNSWENGEKEFSMLVSSAFDRDGYLYCLDHNTESVYIFSHEKKRYSNLDVEITSVDTKSYPTVAFYLNVRSRSGLPVYGLDPSNFILTEDGGPIPGVYTDYLKQLSPSASIVLCVDRSRGNEEYHSEMPWVSDFILKKMRKNDSVKVSNFNSDVWEGNKFDWSRRRTLRAIKSRDYGDGKRIGTALYSAISDLLARVNRRGVVLITDGSVGDDSFTSYSPEDIVHYARSHFIPIYIVAFKEPHPFLKKIADESGGALFRPNRVDDLRTIYDRIKNAEEYRYVLVYSTFKLPSFKGWWSEVKIEVEHRGEKGIEWGGYFVP